MARESLHRLDEASRPYGRLRIAYLRSLAVLEAWEGRTTQAIATLDEAKTLAQELKLPGEIWEVEAKLAELFMANGEHHKAEQARKTAREGIQKLAERIEDVEVKREFLEFARSQVIEEIPMSKI